MTAIFLLDGFCSCIEHMVVLTRLGQATHCIVYCAMSCTKIVRIRSVLMAENMTSLLCLWFVRSAGMQSNNDQGTNVQRSYSSPVCLCLKVCSLVITKHVCQHCCMSLKQPVLRRLYFVLYLGEFLLLVCSVQQYRL